MASRQNLDELRTLVRQKGLRATPSRLAVLELLRSSDAPMSHGDVADRLASQAWDRATIYRNLTDLAEVGLVRRTDVGDHVWRFEAVTEDHEAARTRTSSAPSAASSSACPRSSSPCVARRRRVRSSSARSRCTCAVSATPACSQRRHGRTRTQVSYHVHAESLVALDDPELRRRSARRGPSPPARSSRCTAASGCRTRRGGRRCCRSSSFPAGREPLVREALGEHARHAVDRRHRRTSSRAPAARSAGAAASSPAAITSGDGLRSPQRPSGSGTVVDASPPIAASMRVEQRVVVRRAARPGCAADTHSSFAAYRSSAGSASSPPTRSDTP